MKLDDNWETLESVDFVPVHYFGTGRDKYQVVNNARKLHPAGTLIVHFHSSILTCRGADHAVAGLS